MAEPAVARPPRRVRVRYVVAAAVCLGAVAWLVVGGLASNLVFYRSVSDAVAQRETLGDRRFRIAGEVVPGSIERDVDERVARFEITDGTATATVLHDGREPPELFDDGAPVVCEGAWRGDAFVSDEILIQHGSEYRPPDVESEPDPETAEPPG